VIDLCQTNPNIITGPFYTYRRRITYISPVEVHRLSYLSVLTINPPGPHVTAASWFRIDLSVAALKPMAAFRRLSGHEQTRGIITTCRLVYTSLYWRLWIAKKQISISGIPFLWVWKTPLGPILIDPAGGLSSVCQFPAQIPSPG